MTKHANKNSYASTAYCGLFQHNTSMIRHSGNSLKRNNGNLRKCIKLNGKCANLSHFRAQATPLMSKQLIKNSTLVSR